MVRMTLGRLDGGVGSMSKDGSMATAGWVFPGLEGFMELRLTWESVWGGLST